MNLIEFPKSEPKAAQVKAVLEAVAEEATAMKMETIVIFYATEDGVSGVFTNESNRFTVMGMLAMAQTLIAEPD